MTEARHKPQSAIIGLGATGLSCVRHLVARGHRLAVTDSRESPPGLARLGEIAPEARVAVGRFDSSVLDGADQVVVSPGVSPREPIVLEAVARGLDVVGDIELFAREAGGRVVGITGTNGKSTVTTLLGEMARSGGIEVRVGGNLGEPALDLLAGPTAALYVLELSSFQLELTHSLQLEAAAVLNVSPDHLDRYSSVADYAAAKARIFERCTTAVINAEDAMVMRMPRPDQATLSFGVDVAADYGLVSIDGREWIAAAGEPLLAVDELLITGRHNVANALAALALGDACAVPRDAALAALRSFSGLAHRAQFVAEADGVRWINDSKGTNVGATLAAVSGLAGPLVLIAGGEGKGQDFAPLTAACRGKLRHAVLIGRDGEQLAAVLEGLCSIELANSMEEAVAMAQAQARAGDTVLLSPACASLDMFRDYAHRGEAFADAVRRRLQ